MTYASELQECPYCHSENLERFGSQKGEYWGKYIEVEYQEKCHNCMFHGIYSYGSYEVLEEPVIQED